MAALIEYHNGRHFCLRHVTYDIVSNIVILATRYNYYLLRYRHTPVITIAAITMRLHATPRLRYYCQQVILAAHARLIVQSFNVRASTIAG